MKKYLTLPNVLTGLRILCAAVIAFLPPLSVPFFALYLFCGVTDVADGAIARGGGTVSEFGARLDSVADIFFNAVTLCRLFPVLSGLLPRAVWWVAGGVLAVRLAAYLAAFCRYRRFAALHTYLNKLTGILLFALPFFLLTPVAAAFSFAVCGAGAIASAEELVLHLTSREYDANTKSIFRLAQKNVKNHQT